MTELSSTPSVASKKILTVVPSQVPARWCQVFAVKELNGKVARPLVVPFPTSKYTVCDG